ncbi:hypothetical protein GWK47_018430 [Chionoecetes opilio]|uniref:Uncharacterized protein n=1 Tax=Chionoecetes opilio TaxID=41210 RepID=A0A8J5BXX6_CHIOP|nr:hypothetical protein GWK47_018430 [Chionoecetes opilio]
MSRSHPQHTGQSRGQKGPTERDGGVQGAEILTRARPGPPNPPPQPLGGPGGGGGLGELRNHRPFSLHVADQVSGQGTPWRGEKKPRGERVKARPRGYLKTTDTAPADKIIKTQLAPAREKK